MKHLLLMLIFLAPSWVQADDKLGRLFLSPAERSNLDYLRQTSKPPDRTIKPETAESSAGELPPPPPVSAVTVQGYVKRSDGKGTVWVNRQPLREASSQGDIGVGKIGRTDGRVQLKLQGADKAVALKAGQTYDPVSGAVVERTRDLPEAGRLEAVPPEGKSGKVVVPVADAPKTP